MRRTLLVALVVLGSAGTAAANAGVSLGPIVKVGLGPAEDVFGLRGGLEGDTLLLAVERYQAANMQRVRGELGMILPIPLGKGAILEPQIGFMPVDYMTFDDGTRVFTFSATGAVRFRMRVFSVVWLLFEPVRLERRVARLVIYPGEMTIPSWDHDKILEFSTAVQMSLRW